MQRKHRDWWYRTRSWSDLSFWEVEGW